MEETWKKVRLLIFAGFGIVLLESLLGCSMLYTGILFREYDSKSAEEMMTVIKESNPEYYELLINETDVSHKKEFERLYTTKGNRVLLNYGIIIMFLALLTMVPFALLYMKLNTTENKAEDKDKRAGKEKKEPEESF